MGFSAGKGSLQILSASQHLPLFYFFLTTARGPTRYAESIVQRDFVIQLKQDSDPKQGLFRGRVEHLDTGREGTFQTLEELGALIVRLLAVPCSKASNS